MAGLKKDIQLTEHFWLREFIRSGTAERLGLDNVPTEEVIGNLKHLCETVLEPLRVAMGEPIVINSGYRSPPVNKAVGGVANSQHIKGEAADIRIPRCRDGDTGSDVDKGYDLDKGRRYFEFIVGQCDYDQCLYEHDRQGNRWIHVSCRRKGNRKRCDANYNNNDK